MRADQRDADYWLSQANLDAAPEGRQGRLQGRDGVDQSVRRRQSFKPFDGATQLVPGISAVPTYGHTKGHTIYIVESKGQKMAVLGDLMHVAVRAVSAAVGDDPVRHRLEDGRGAAQEGVCKDAAKQRLLARRRAPALPRHRPHPADGSGYVFVPANYSVPR